jgi:hypothetical protein
MICLVKILHLFFVYVGLLLLGFVAIELKHLAKYAQADKSGEYETRGEANASKKERSQNIFLFRYDT